MKLRVFDFHSKLQDDARITTTSGGFVSLVSCIIIVFLFTSELYTYLSTPPKEILTVDTERGQRLPIFFNITFHGLSCSVLSVDTSDVSGEEHQDIAESIFKIPIAGDGSVFGEPEILTNVGVGLHPPAAPDQIPENMEHVQSSAGLGRKAPSQVLPNIKSENYCGDCFGAGEPGECCNTCDDIKAAYQRKGWRFHQSSEMVQCTHEKITNELKDSDKTGCQIAGQILVAKVKGKLQITPSKHGVHIHHALHSEHGTVPNTSHTIHYLRFGTKLQNYKEAAPLDGHSSLITEKDSTAAFRYHVNIVPTSYEKSAGSVTKTNQYAVTQEALYMDSNDFHEVPGVFFDYDISPIRVHVIENPRSLITFLTNLAAILGGVFTISGIVDSVIFYSSRKL